MGNRIVPYPDKLGVHERERRRQPFLAHLGSLYLGLSPQHGKGRQQATQGRIQQLTLIKGFVYERGDSKDGNNQITCLFMLILPPEAPREGRNWKWKHSIVCQPSQLHWLTWVPKIVVPVPALVCSLFGVVFYISFDWILPVIDFPGKYEKKTTAVTCIQHMKTFCSKDPIGESVYNPHYSPRAVQSGFPSPKSTNLSFSISVPLLMLPLMWFFSKENARRVTYYGMFHRTRWCRKRWCLVLMVVVKIKTGVWHPKQETAFI